MRSGVLKNGFEDAAPSYGEGKDLPAKALDAAIRLLEQPAAPTHPGHYVADTRQTLLSSGDMLETGTQGRKNDQ